MKKLIFILCLVICIFFAVSSVCAGDVNETVMTTDWQIELTQDTVDDNLKSNENNEIIKANPETFTDLDTAINGNNDSDVNLHGDYTFQTGNDDNFAEGIKINRAVTIHGNGYTINANNASRIFNVKTTSTVVFKDIIFVNANSDEGGAIKGACTVINCTFANNKVEYEGGAIKGTCTVINCTFTNNKANSGGAISGKCSVINSSFTNNTAKNGGGGAITGDCNVRNCTFTNNSADEGGGAIANKCTVINCTFINNKAGSGGAICAKVENAAIIINSTFTSNNARNGGAIEFKKKGNVTNCTFISNNANWGGAISGKCMVVDSIFTGNTAKNDAGAMGEGDAVNCTFTSNVAANNAGAMKAGDAVNCTFINNTAEIGGAMVSGSAIGCTFSNNYANGDSGIDDADNVINCTFINQNGTAVGNPKLVSNCTFINLTFDDDGGAAICAIGVSEFSVVSCKFINCSAIYGGAIKKEGGDCVIVFCNFTNCYANEVGAAVYNDEGYCNITQCIFTDCYTAGKNTTIDGAIYCKNGQLNISNCTYQDINPVNSGNTTPSGPPETPAPIAYPVKVTASDLNMLYSSTSTFKVTVYGSDGKLASGASVVIKVGGKKVATVKTGSNGVATFKPTQTPGTYKISATALGKTITKKLTVKHVVTLKKVTVKKSAKKLILQATLAKVDGKVLKKKKVTFKFNGKTYSSKTNSKGVVKVTIKKAVLKKLKVGKKVTYQATYLKDTVKKSVKVKK